MLFAQSATCISLSISVSDEGFTCDKCREIVRLTEKVLELETRIQTLVEDSKNVRAVDTALDVISSGLLYIVRSGNVSAPIAGQLGDSGGGLVAGQTPLFRSDQNIKQVLPTQ